MTFDQIFEIVSYAVDQYRLLRSENVSLKEQLAEALANDAADDQAIADAQKAAQEAQAKYDAELAKLQSLVEGIEVPTGEDPLGDVGVIDAPVTGGIDNLPEDATAPTVGDSTGTPSEEVPDATVVSESRVQG